MRFKRKRKGITEAAGTMKGTINNGNLTINGRNGRLNKGRHGKILLEWLENTTIRLQEGYHNYPISPSPIYPI
jgi:hypothetical protein